MKKTILLSFLIVSCHKPTQFVVSPETPQIIELTWEIAAASKRPDYYYFQLDTNPPIKLSQIAYCKENYGYLCRYRTSITDNRIHDYTVWPATPSEEGPKATVRFSVVNNFTETPPAEPSGLRVVPIK